MHLEHALPAMFDFLRKQFPTREGVRKWQYEKFKNQLLRGIGFVQGLSSKIKYDEKRFIELTNHQLDLFRRVASNKNIITSGPAGCGKTIVAKTIAQDFLNNDKKVLFLCFNRSLANKLRYDFDKYEANIDVSTFHSFARRIIEKFDKDWWTSNADSKSEDFWNLEVPVKLEECLPFVKEKYDTLIVDEGQDFKELWYDMIFKLISNEGHKLIFLDEMQNIFGHYTEVPSGQSFMKYSLPENCRNTKNIVKYLSSVISKDIKSFDKSPTGDEIVYKEFKNQTEEQKYLLDEIKSLTREHDIASDQILILLNSGKSDSCIAETVKIGKLEIKGIDNKGRFQRDAINYTTINTFKGLEADIVFVVDVDQIPDDKKLEKLYTETSRARFKLYVLCKA
jgi:superfamily I DNA/RNA helicase